MFLVQQVVRYVFFNQIVLQEYFQMINLYSHKVSRNFENYNLFFGISHNRVNV